MQGIKAGAYIGSNGLFDSATVNAYRASIKGLSATQAEAALSASGLNAAQRQQILTSKESTVANVGQATSFNVLTKAVWANVKAMAKWLVTTPTGWITLAIGATAALITAYNNVEKKQNELIENARNLQEEYRSFAKDTAGKITSLEGQAEEFNKLAKGVDKYGNNISLASDEYDRYKSIVAEILGYSPELIQGYDAEGNAIADKNGLLERSIELLKEEQRLKLKEMTTDEKTGEAYDAAEAGWQQVQGYEGANTRNEIARWFDDNALRGGVNYEVDIAKVLGIKDEWKEEGNNLQNAIINNIETVAKNIKEKKAELLALKDGKGNALFTEAEIDAMIDQADTWQQQYADWQRDIEDAKHGMDDQFELYAQKADGYNDLTDAQKAFVNEYIKATGDIIDADGNLLSEDEIIKKAEGYTKFVEKLANDPNFEEARTKINTLFSLDKSKMSASEYEKQVNAILKELQDKFNLTDDEVMDFKIALGFTFTSDGKTQTGELLDQVKGKLKDEFDGKADELTPEELQIAAKIVADIPEGTLLSWDELQKKIKETQGNANEMTVSLSDLEGASDKISKLSSAFKELSDDGYITTKTIGEIQEATGLAGDEWAGYEQKLLNAKKGSAEFNQVMSDLTYKIVENAFAGKDLTDVTEDQIAAVLRDNGVTNANAVAHEAASRAKAEQYIKSQNLSKATNIESVKLIENAKAAGIDENAYRSLLAEEILFNNNKLDSKSKCEEILKIASAAGVAKVTMSSLNEEIAAVAGKKIGSGSRKGYIESLGGTVITSKNREDGKTNKGSLYIVGGKEFESFEDAAYFANAKKEQELISSAFKPITIPSYSTGGSGGGGSDSKESNDTKDNFDDSYHSAVDAWLEENKKQIERFEKEREKLNRQFENALDSGNKEQAEILRSKLAENVQKQKDILHEQNEAHRITQNDLLQSLYQYVPEFKDKSWDEISQVDLYNVEEKLSKAANEASDDAKNQASLKLNQFKGIVDDLKAINDAIEENSNSWWELDNDQKDYWESLIDFQNELSNTWIDNQKAFQKLSEKEELDAYGRMINNNKSFQKQILKDTTISEEAKLALIKKTNDEITEIEKNAYDLRKDLYGEATDFGSKYIDSQKTLLQAYYDVTNSIREEQHEITKELEASKTMYEYLNEDTRKLLFNQEDYNELSEELYYIQYKASKLQREYTRELENSTINTIEEITSNYEMQYETLMKSYEIAKADLEVAKKKAKLNNVLNERNVRMFVNGQWQWVANTQDVIDAKSELADAEYERKTAELEKRQTASINNLTKQQDELSTVVSMFEDGVIDLGTAIYDAESALRTIPSTMANIISEIQSFSLNKNDRYGSVTYDKDFDYSSVMSGLDKNSNEWKILNEKRNAKIAGEGLSYNKYASGTRKAAPGKALLGEEEPEILLSKLGLTPITQPTFKTMDGGEVVFNSEQIANLRTLWDIGNGFKPNFDYVNKSVPQTIDNSNCNNVIINGLTVDSGSTDGKALINALRRYTANH